MHNIKKVVHLSYYAVLKDQSGVSDETIKTTAKNAQDLYGELKKKYGFHLSNEQLKVSINDNFRDWETEIGDHDRVVFIPPVAGG